MTRIKHKVNKRRVNALVVFPVVLISIVALVVIKLVTMDSFKVNPKDSISQVILNKRPLLVDNTVIHGALVANYPSFEDLTFDSFSRASHVGEAQNYNNKFYVQGKELLELDAQRNHILRRLNTNVVCPGRYTITDNYLYMLCTGDLKYAQGVYKISLATGDIVKSYKNHPTPALPYVSFTNGRIAHLGSLIFTGSWDGVYVIDTSSDYVKSFPQKDFGETSKVQQYSVGANQKFAWAISTHNDSVVAIRFYDAKTQDWTVYQQKDLQLALKTDKDVIVFGHSADKLYLNSATGELPYFPSNTFAEYSPETGFRVVLNLSDIEVKNITKGGNSVEAFNIIREKYFPQVYLRYWERPNVITYMEEGTQAVKSFGWPFEEFWTMSDRVDDEYYFANNNGIAKLVRGQEFPQYIGRTIPESVYPRALYETNDKKYLIIFGEKDYVSDGSMGEQYPRIFIYKIDEGVFSDISPSKATYDRAMREYSSKYLSNQNVEWHDYDKLTSLNRDVEFNENNQVISLKHSDTEPIGEIDLLKETFRLK